VQVGYTDGTSHGQGWGFAGGFDDHILGTRLLPSTQIPGGSVTKTWTGVAILQVRGVHSIPCLDLLSGDGGDRERESKRERERAREGDTNARERTC
jgi:hypothetical protein